jgi:hypothetical protein
LPTALVFLQFLRERGAASLLGGDSAKSSSADQNSHGSADEDDDHDLPEKDAAVE